MTRLAATLVIAACSAALPPPIAVHGHVARKRVAYSRVEFATDRWDLSDGARVANDGLTLRYGRRSSDYATHQLVELDRPGLWTIAVHHRPNECDREFSVQLGPPGRLRERIASAEFSNDTGVVAIDLDHPRPIELRILAFGGHDCLGIAKFDRVEIIRSEP